MDICTSCRQNKDNLPGRADSVSEVRICCGVFVKVSGIKTNIREGRLPLLLTGQEGDELHDEHDQGNHQYEATRYGETHESQVRNASQYQEGETNQEE